MSQSSATPHSRKDFGGSESARYDRKLARRAQLKLIRDEEIMRDQIVRSLTSAGLTELADTLDGCHRAEMHRQCRDCARQESWWNHCDNRCCPICAPRLSAHRKSQLEFWTARITTPLHIVLTSRNTSEITSAEIDRLQTALQRLRRRSVCKSWKSGCWSMETTNEGRGWHVHFHVLVESSWTDVRELARQWSELIGQTFAQVKLQQVRGQDYLREVCKYSVKGSDLMRWGAADLAAYLVALDGHRTFGVFGKLYGQRKEWKNFTESLREESNRCPDCGGNHWKFWDAQEWEAEEILRESRPPPLVHVRTLPPPEQMVQMSFEPR
jgi:hypothetical protein